MDNYIVVKEAHKAPAALQVENPVELETLQKIVGGYIEEIRFQDGNVLVCDDEATLKGKPPCVTIQIDNREVCIRGTIAICKMKNEDYCTMSYKEAESIIKAFIL